MNIHAVQTCAEPDWLDLRAALWPHSPVPSHLKEMQQLLSEPHRFGQFLARNAQGVAVGLVEASVRTDYVNGTSTSPVGFLEGIYVRPDCRQQGVATALVQRAMQWAGAQGCSEFASDTSVDNPISLGMHRKLGFVETERVVYFRKPIEPSSDSAV